VNARPHLPPSHEDILTALRRYGPLTKGDASRRSGYAMSTTHDAMRRLQRFGLVEVVMTVQGDARGRTRNVYGLVGVHRRLRSRRTFILELVETLRAVTTQELAAHVGINPKTASYYVKEFLADGAIKLVGWEFRPTGGRPAPLWGVA
jgi:predicted ArsR family transcriptional regulator